MTAHINESASNDRAKPDLPSAGRRSLWRVLALALALRVAWAIAVPVVPESDCHAYDVFARNLAAGHGYCWQPDEGGTAYWPVGTSFLYSIVYRLFGFHYGPIVALNVLIGAAVVWLTAVLASRWFGQRTGLVAGLLMAVWPSQIEFTTVLASEVPFMACVCAALAVWYGGIGALGWRVLATGVLLAMAAYLRPTALLLPVVLGASQVARDGRPLRTGLAVIAMLALIAACIAPWSVRNTRLFGQRVLISTNGGTNTWMGNNPQTDGGYQPVPEMPPGTNEAQRDSILGGQAMQYIRARPFRFLWRSAVKLVRLHERETIGVKWNTKGLAQRYPQTVQTAIKWFGQVFWIGVLLLGLGGAFILFVHEGLWRGIMHPACLIWAYFSAVHAVTVIQDRYHFASIPFIAVLAASCIGAVRDRRAAGGRDARSVMPAASTTTT